MHTSIRFCDNKAASDALLAHIGGVGRTFGSCIVAYAPRAAARHNAVATSRVLDMMNTLYLRTAAGVGASAGEGRSSSLTVKPGPRRGVSARGSSIEGLLLYASGQICTDRIIECIKGHCDRCLEFL